MQVLIKIFGVDTNDVQLATFNFISNEVKIDMSNCLLYNPNGMSPHFQHDEEYYIVDHRVNKLKDGNVETKFLDSNFKKNKKSEVNFQFENNVKIDAYEWYTANDLQVRDPKCWKLYGSNDYIKWVLLDEQTNISNPNRHAKMGPYKL
jgi:hypothetical protein